ncbi:unnamed protein product [Ambrosiozyma monospora]|uniref:Unnamed protein product n=1 Tax=Ambrosiozyma monospora TaxID=43982 RepID=A0ACB5T4T5_AMBMO|nr:unnamed protein product [Ambrosiozyma monospora]
MPFIIRHGLISLILMRLSHSRPLPLPDDQAPFPKYPPPKYPDESDGDYDGNISLILVMFLGMFIGFALIIIVSTLIFLVQKFIRKRIMLSNDIAGSLDDAALEAEEDRRALDELAPNEQELYFQSKEFLKLNPISSQELSLSQALIIQEKGVNAWEFKPNFENADLINVANKTEIEFLGSDGQELSLQTNFPIPKQNET